MSIKYHVMNNWDTDYERCLNNLTLDELIRAFYIGYEVEPIFEVGDWVKDTSTNAVIKINDRQHRNNLIDSRHTTIRHATPEEIAEEKQRRWWAKHGREVWELRRNDLVCDKDGFSYTINLIKKDYVEFVEFGKRKKVKEIKESFKVICFVEDRKDV